MAQDPEKEGWERSDFPIVCETCLGPNPYVRMQRIEYGAECHISGRPYTKFRWRPGSDARYKSTIICQEVAKAKNVCQVCLLDLQHNLPVQVRDKTMNAVVEDIPESAVGLEYQLALKQSKGELGIQYEDAEPTRDILRLSRTTPYYKRNRAQICSFFVRGECKRGAECPYRHEMPQTGELAEQNIRDRYYGINDPVAKKMLNRLGTRVKLQPPEDKDITTLYVGNVETGWKPDDFRDVFSKFGEISNINVVPSKSCAFVTYASRADAEEAADKLDDALIIRGTRCKLLWGKPRATDAAKAAAAAGMPPPQGAPSAPAADGTAATPNFFGLPAPRYPSMDPSLHGTALVPNSGATGPEEPAGKRARTTPAGPGPPRPVMVPPGHLPLGPGMGGPPPWGQPPPMGPPTMHMYPPPGWPGMAPPGMGPPPGVMGPPPYAAGPPNRAGGQGASKRKA